MLHYLEGKKSMLSGTKKWMPQVPCSSVNQIWRRKEVSEAGNWDLLHSTYTPAHLQASSWKDQVTAVFVSWWYIRVY